MGAGPNRRQHLLRFGGGEDEDEVFRRFLHNLEQGVEPCCGDHVGLIDDEHPVARLGWRVERAIPQLAGVIHTAVAGGVEFDHVDAARRVGRKPRAGVADPAGSGRRSLYTVQRPRQDARGRGLPAATRPGEEVRVVDPAGFQGDGKRLGDVLLAHHLGECCRSVLAVEGHGQPGYRRPATKWTREGPLRRRAIRSRPATKWTQRVR